MVSEWDPNGRKLQVGFQVTASNPMIGLEGRCNLLKRLGTALAMERNRQFFGAEVCYVLGMLLCTETWGSFGRVSMLWHCGLASGLWSNLEHFGGGYLWIVCPLRSGCMFEHAAP